MTALTPVIWYAFKSWTLGSISIINEGSLGSTNNGVLKNSIVVISSYYDVGTHTLLIGNHGTGNV